MKKITAKILLLVVASLGSLKAQEAWVLEMPNKYSDYLIKKALAGEATTVSDIVEKLPALIAKKEIKEIELITWKAENGKVHPKKMMKIGDQEKQLGSTYQASGGSNNERRILTITTPPTERDFSIDLYGKLAKTWMPTFSYRSETMTLLVLERSTFDGEDSLKLDHSCQLTIDAKAKATFAWYSSIPVDGQLLSFSDLAVHPANDKITFGAKILASIRKEGESLLRMEVHSSSPAAKDVLVLSHNQATFPGHSQKTGPLRQETITIADKKVTDDGEVGSWTLTLTGK